MSRTHECLTRPEEISLSDLLPEEEWRPYGAVAREAARRGLPFALGGGLALSVYSGRWRNTKDIDLFVMPRDRWPMVDLVTEMGFVDLYDQEPYDRTWIYRCIRDGAILDLIWTMPNHRMQVDEDWLTLGQPLEIHGVRLRALPPEEYLWTKLYVLQKDRCDWPDLFNVLRGYGCRIDWTRLLRRLGPDYPLLASVLSAYGWVYPDGARDIPPWVRSAVGLAGPPPDPDCENGTGRPFLLDTRDWFGPTLERSGLCR